jgi:hypothetical protein
MASQTGSWSPVLLDNVRASDSGMVSQTTIGCSLQRRAITSCAFSGEIDAVATTGADGAINLVHAVHAADGAVDPTTLCPPSAFRSYHSSAWVQARALAAVGTVEAVEIWDPRQLQRAVATSPSSWIEPGEQLVTVAAQPSRPTECIVGHRSAATVPLGNCLGPLVLGAGQFACNMQ